MQRSETSHLVFFAATSAGAMIAFQVGGKATRDALLLSNFPVTVLPGMLLASAVISIVASLAISRLISIKGPDVVVPWAFAASSFLLVIEWLMYATAPRATTTVFYLHIAGFGAILVSGFWSIISELFDPRTAKAQIGRIAAGGTLGGLLGGLIAERIGVVLSIRAMLPVLAILSLICALMNFRLRASNATTDSDALPEGSVREMKSGFEVIRAVPYLKHLALLVMLGTVAEALLDYVLKAQASATFAPGQQLMRFFALFYTGISLLTFLVQTGFSRYALQRFGLTTTMTTMPFMVAAGGLGALIWPGILSTGLVRGAQSVLRSSLFRSGYELLYSPVSASEKRAAKTIVDVAYDKLGDAIGAGVIRAVLFIGVGAIVSNRVLTFIAVLLGGLSLVLTLRLSRGYVASLERSLLNRAADLDLIDIEERTTRKTMLRTLGTVDFRKIRLPNATPEQKPRQSITEEIPPNSPARLVLDLQSEDAAVIRSVLTGQNVLDPLLIAPTIRLLARDDVSEDAVRALRTVAATAVGQLTDALLNADEDFAVRRRLPRVLAYCESERAVDGLMRGLVDSRFEVRFSCGRGLSRICGADKNLCPAPDKIYAAARQEIVSAQRLSEAPRMLDNYEGPPTSIHSDSSADMLWNSTDIRLEHIFRLLSLTLTPEPLHAAFQALHVNDAYLRGTALEYLESILPAGIREALLEFLEGASRPEGKSRPADHIAEELMRSRPQIAMKLVISGTTTVKRVPD